MRESRGGPESSRLNWARSRVYIGLVVFDYFIRVFFSFPFFFLVFFVFSGFGVLQILVIVVVFSYVRLYSVCDFQFVFMNLTMVFRVALSQV